MEIFDLGISWNWQLDNEFVQGLNDEALKESLKPYLLHAFNFYRSLRDIAENNIYFKSFLDRTLDDGSPLSKASDFLKTKNFNFINHPDQIKRSLDKPTTHQEFVNNSIPVPKTVFVNPQDNQPLESKIKTFPKPFVVKLADNSFGKTVSLEANSLEDVLRLRVRYGNINCFAQEKIHPTFLGNKLSSFKVVYCLGETFPCWWHLLSHNYDILCKEDTDKFGLSFLSEIAKNIARVSKLDFFTVDLIMDKKNNFFVVNYADAWPDMRRKSKFDDGVPDEVVDAVTKKIISFVKENKSGTGNP